MFPTKGKSKIPQSLSYPANSKVISEALADVPQAKEISISFLFLPSSTLHKNINVYPVLSVTYYHSPPNQFTPHYFEEKSGRLPKWSVDVQPVPKVIRHRIQELLQSQGLPKVRNWLFAKERLKSH